MHLSKSAAFLYLLIYANSYSQIEKISPLRVGDKISDINLNNVYNYPGGKASISDFKSKLLILDFWNKGCAPCIRAMPKMQELNNRYKKSLSVVLVTANTKDQLNDLFKNSPILKSIKLPNVIGDTILTALFPHTFEPYHVWIDSTGTVVATTRDYNATPEHIEAFLKGEDIGLSTYNESNLNLNSNSSLLQPNNNPFDKIIYSSIITKPLHARRTSFVLSDSISNKLTGLRFQDASLLFLYKNAYQFNAPYDRIVLEVDNPKGFYEPKDDNQKDQWFNENNFCYEIRIAPDKHVNMNQLLKIMQRDLEGFFNITGTVEDRQLKCWALTITGNISKFRSVGGESEIQEGPNRLMLRNYGMDWLREEIMYANLGINDRPIIDETNYKGQIDIDINASLTDLKALNIELTKYGLKLIEEEKELKVLVLKQIKN